MYGDNQQARELDRKAALSYPLTLPACLPFPGKEQIFFLIPLVRFTAYRRDKYREKRQGRNKQTKKKE